MEVDLEKDILTVLEDGKQYALKSIGEVELHAIGSSIAEQLNQMP